MNDQQAANVGCANLVKLLAFIISFVVFVAGWYASAYINGCCDHKTWWVVPTLILIIFAMFSSFIAMCGLAGLIPEPKNEDKA
jgi:hypothetical protein